MNYFSTSEELRQRVSLLEYRLAKNVDRIKELAAMYRSAGFHEHGLLLQFVAEIIANENERADK